MKTLAELHERMRGWPEGSPQREALANRHAELRAAINQFALTPEEGTLALLNGMWATAWRVFAHCGRYDPTPGGKGGAQEKLRAENTA